MKDNTKELLLKAGWSENRHIAIKSDILFLKEKGYTILDTFIDFYTEFGNLNITCVVNQNERNLSFNITTPVRYDYDSVIIEDYPRITGSQTLNPIGNIDGSSYLVIDEAGRIYSLYDGNVMIIGVNNIEALDNLCNLDWREFKEIPIPDWW